MLRVDITFEEYVAECQREALEEYTKSVKEKMLEDYANDLRKQGLIAPA